LIFYQSTHIGTILDFCDFSAMTFKGKWFIIYTEPLKLRMKRRWWEAVREGGFLYWVTWLPALAGGAKAPFECGRGGSWRIVSQEGGDDIQADIFSPV